MTEGMAFDVAFAMITQAQLSALPESRKKRIGVGVGLDMSAQAAMDGTENELAAAFSQSKGTDSTYSGDSMLIGNYAARSATGIAFALATVARSSLNRRAPKPFRR